MDNNLPQIYKNNFFQNIWHKIKSWFWGTKKIEQSVQSTNVAEETKNEFVEQIKVNVVEKNKENAIETFMKQADSKPEMLETLSNEKLEKILQYYLNENNKKRAMLKKLSV